MRNSCRIFNTACVILVLLSGSGCGLLRLDNPRRAGTYPEKTEALRLIGEVTPQRRCFDVKHYDLDLRIDPAQKTIDGNVTITSQFTESCDSVQIDLRPQFVIDRLLLDGVPVSFKRRYTAVSIPVNGAAGRVFKLTVSYKGIPDEAPKPPWLGGAVWNVDSDLGTWAGVACETEGASTWWPCKDHTSDEADSTSIHLTVPAGYTAVSNGRLVSSEEKGSTMTWNWKVSYPINTYNITYYVGRYFHIHDEYTSKVTGQILDLDYYVLPENKNIAGKHFSQVKSVLDVYERRFGPYPWYRDGYKLVQSPYEGMEHQTAIAYGEGFQNDAYNGFDYIIVHETAHEWWGNSVTAADLGDAWIQEGFATYAEALYVEDTKGKKAYNDYLLQSRWTIKNKRTLARPEGIRYFNFRDADIYNKGAWMLHSLRNMMNNDSLFLAVIHDFAVTYKMQLVTSATFIQFVNQKTGKDYTWFFNQYLYNRFVPELEYYASGSKLYYRWSDRTAEYFTMPQRVAGTGGKDRFIVPEKRTIQVADFGSTYFSLPDSDYLVLMRENKKLVRLYRKQLH